MPVVLTAGSFDIMHLGHMRFFDKCAEFGDVKVGLNTDEFITKYRGVPPIMNYQERLDTLIELGFSEWDIEPNNQSDGTIKDLINHFMPDSIVVGSDWLKKDYLPQIGLTPDYLTEEGINLIFVPYDTTISSTEIKRRIRNEV